MIDTVVLRIHNLSKYPQIYEQYYAPTKKKGTVTQALVDENTGEVIENYLVPSTVFHDTNRVLPLSHRSNMRIPSSHYHLAYAVYPAKDYIEFNFSIPKYIYSTNVLQFVNEVDQSASTCFGILIAFIVKFLKENFIQTPLYEDVEINRIDFCYNQFFICKADALNYLDEQKKLLVKYARTSKNNFRSYDTSLMYITRRYSFKIYHKGTEFEKHDLKELMKNNPLKLNLKEMHEESQRILRYEMTFRSSYLSYLMQHYFFVSDKKAMYEQYSNHKVSRFMRKMKTLGYGKGADSYLKTGKFFTLKSIYDSPGNYEKTLFNHNMEKRTQKQYFDANDTITFDQTFFNICFDTFWDKVKQYQLANIMSVEELSKRIDNYKSDISTRKKLKISTSKEERGLDKTRLLICGLLIQQNYNFDSLKNVLPNSSFYRLKSELKKLGITSNHTTVSIPPPKLDYIDYRITFGKYHRHYL